MNRLMSWFWIAFLALLGGVVAMTGVSYSSLTRGQIPAAAELFVAEGEANSRLANTMVRGEEYEEAERYGRLALERSLADIRSVRSIALAAEKRGDADTFAALLKAAGDLTWRDSPAQAKLFEQKLIAEDYLGAIDHADALMRRRDATDELIEVFIVAALDDTLIAPIADKLAARPTWRSSFFANAKLPNDAYYRSFSGLMQELNARGADAAVTREELAPIVYSLTRSKRLQQGLQLWHDLFPQDHVILAAGQSVDLAWSNADNSAKPTPFDWFVPSNQRTYVRVTQMGVAGQEQTLEVDPNPRAAGTLITKTLAMPAGRFTLSMDAPQSSEKTIARVFWTLKCDGRGDREPLARVPGSTKEWRGSVGNCQAVTLELNMREGARRELETLLVDKVSLKAGL